MSVKLVYDVVYADLTSLVEDTQMFSENTVSLYNEFVDAGKIIYIDSSVDTNTLTKTTIVTYVDQTAWDEYHERIVMLKASGLWMIEGNAISNPYLEYDDGSKVYLEN